MQSKKIKKYLIFCSGPALISSITIPYGYIKETMWVSGIGVGAFSLFLILIFTGLIDNLNSFKTNKNPIQLQEVKQ